MRPRNLRLPAAVALLLAIACDDRSLPTAPNTGRPALDIADAARDYRPGFYWLPPIVKLPAHTGAFDAEVSPAVEICELAGDACGAVLATYTMASGTGGEIIRLDIEGQHYHVNWHTNEFELSTTKLYRVSVRAGDPATLLGYADVQPAANGAALKKVDSDEYIGHPDQDACAWNVRKR
jgi:hypothetical protein